MKEIKFRAWTGERIINDIRLKSAHGIRLVCQEDLAPHEMSDDKVVFMQYTGLKDKNGKEIYEGDILVDLKGDKREVKYVDNGFWCEYPNGDHYFPHIDYREVIGNIYENPGLIK